MRLLPALSSARAFTAIGGLIFLLLLPLTACAQAPTGTQTGTYVWTHTDSSGNVTARSPAFSGGQWFSSYYQPGTPHPYGSSGTGTGTGDSSMQVNSTGTVTAAFTWSDAGNPAAPAPPCVIKQTGRAEWYGPFPFQPTASCSDGLGDPEVDTGGSQSFRGVSSGTRYSIVSPDASGVVRVSLVGAQAKIDPNSGGGGGYNYNYFVSDVSWRVDAYPITINLTGTTPDSSGNLNILVGQGCGASISGLPGGTGWGTPVYAWSVSGTAFQQWSPTTPAIGTAPANPNASYYVGGYGPSTNPTAKWYWNDPNNASETVSCTVTLTPPAGQGNQFSVTATKTVAVQVPRWIGTETAGYMQVNTSAPNAQGGFRLYAGPPAGQAGQAGGINWTATTSSPLPFNTGTLQLVQIITPYDGYNTSLVPGLTHSDPNNGLIGLDTQCPYGWASLPTNFGGGPTPYTSNDSPSLPLDNTRVSAVMQHTFTDFLMFVPPGTDIQWVPLATSGWSTNGSATIPPSGNWADYVATYGSDSAGTVSTSNGGTFTAGNTFPTWTRINTGQVF